MFDDKEILADTIVSPDGTCTFTLPDGHKIQRAEQPATGRDIIEWCEGVREIEASRAHALAEEQIRVKEKRIAREKAERTELLPPPVHDDLDDRLDPEKPFLRPPSDPYEYALSMLNTNQENTRRLAETISSLILEEQQARKMVVQWSTIVETIKESLNETGTELVDVVPEAEGSEPTPEA